MNGYTRARGDFYQKSSEKIVFLTLYRYFPKQYAVLRFNPLERSTMTQRIIRFPEVKRKVGYGHTTIYEKISIGEFPRPISLGARAVGWIESEVDHWIATRIEISRNKAGVV